MNAASVTETAPPAPFVNLRAFAAAAAAAPAPGSGDGGNWATARVPAPVPGGGLGIAALLLEPGHGIASATGSEVVLVLEGALSLTADTATIRLGPGEAAILPMGSDFHWRADEPVRAVTISADRPGPQGARLVRIAPDAPHEPSATPDPRLLAGEQLPLCAQHVDFRSADGGFYCGTWSSSPYHRLPMTYGHWEAMYLLEGEVAFGDAEGNETLVGPGDFIVVPQGQVASWRAIGPTRKLFAILRP